MTILDSVHTNILADGEVSGRTPDAEGDFYLVTDAQADHNYWHERIVDSILASSSTPTAEFLILHGGIVSDSGSGQIDISECLAIGKNSSGDRRLIRIPALTNVSIPTGWNDGRDIWVIARHDYKLGSATRTHRAGTSYHYQIQDTYYGDSNGYVSTSSDDLFTDSDPSATDTILTKFTMTGTTFANTGWEERSPILKPLNDDKVVGSSLKFESSYIEISPFHPWFCMSLPDQIQDLTHFSAEYIAKKRSRKFIYDEMGASPISAYSGSWSGSVFTLDNNAANIALLAELAEDYLFAGSPTTGWRILSDGTNEFNITAISTSARQITVNLDSKTASGTAITIYTNRVYGSTTSCRHFSEAGLATYQAGGSKFRGMRRRDSIKAHAHNISVYAGAGSMGPYTCTTDGSQGAVNTSSTQNFGTTETQAKSGTDYKYEYVGSYT